MRKRCLKCSRPCLPNSGHCGGHQLYDGPFRRRFEYLAAWVQVLFRNDYSPIINL